MAIDLLGVVDPTVRELFTVMVARYLDAIAGVSEPWGRQLCGFTSTNALRLKFPINLQFLDGFREWIGERDIKDVDMQAFFIDSKPFERSVRVPLDVALAPGEANGYVNQVPALVAAAATHPNRLVRDILQNGKTTVTTWDGEPLFSATHPLNVRDASVGDWSNLHTAKPFTAENYEFARRAFRALKAPDGVTSLGFRLTHVLGPSDLEPKFLRVFNQQMIILSAANVATQAAESNVFVGTCKEIIGPELDNEPGVWYALGLAHPGVWPIEMQMANGGTPDIKIIGDGTEHATMFNEVVFAGKLFGNAGAAWPQCIMRFEPS